MTKLESLIRARLLTGSPRTRALREAAGLSLADLADSIGVDSATLARWEHGTTRPRAAAALRWLAALDAIERTQQLASRAVADRDDR